MHVTVMDRMMHHVMMHGVVVHHAVVIGPRTGDGCERKRAGENGGSQNGSTHGWISVARRLRAIRIRSPHPIVPAIFTGQLRNLFA
jgi:hypothetical protein